MKKISKEQPWPTTEQFLDALDQAPKAKMALRATLSALVVVTACGGERPSAPPAPAAELTCAEHIAFFRSIQSGPPPTYPDEAFVDSDAALPVVAGSRPIPVAHEPIDFHDAPRDPSGEATYVELAGSEPVTKLPATGEVRLLVRKPDAELVAQHVEVMPRTPEVLRARLPAMKTLPDAGDEFLRLARRGACRLSEVFGLMKDGGSIDTVGPATADMLDACHCAHAELDTLTSLLVWLLLPYPDVGYVVVRRDVVEALPAGSTIADAAAALAR